MSDNKLFSYFEIEFYTNFVRTKSKSIQEYRSSFRPIMIRDLYSLKTFGSGFGIEMKGGHKK
jgi:hypothetical protein